MSESGNAGRGIRSQLNRIVLIPAITFLMLFVVLSAATVTQALSLRRASAESADGVRLSYALAQLQQERRASTEYLGAPSAEALGLLREQQTTTDEALAEMTPTKRLSTEFQAALDARGALREEVAAEHIDRDETQDRYSAIIDLGIGHYDARGRLFQDGRAVAASATVVQTLRAQEAFARADALLSGAVAAGELTAPEQAAFAGLVEELGRRLSEVEPALAASVEKEYADLTGSAEWSGALETAEQIGVWRPDPVSPPFGEPAGAAEQVESVEPVEPAVTLPPAAADWRADADAVHTALSALTDAQTQVTVKAIDVASAGVLSAAVGGSTLALFAGALAYGIASRTAGRLTARLSRLRRDTLELADSELPELVRRLERGESVDLREQPRRLDYGLDEIGQVADAFNTAQRTAVAATVKQAEIREGANRVFLALAHRDQSLLQRQLNLLDRIEREEEDPDLLANLFHLDHLATRGRRNAENLIILAGGKPGRRWRNPIPLVDILRGAVSEIEEYPRIRVRPVPDLAVLGEAVADVIHLLAELVENAASYSPPHAGVCVHTETVPKGLVVEIEDRGLGISEENLAEANERLATAPEFDVMALDEDARLGLFVVARLAAKHGIGVRLANSPYGGTRAIVLLPASLVVTPVRSTTLPPAPDSPKDLLAPLSTPTERPRRPEPESANPTPEAVGEGETRPVRIGVGDAAQRSSPGERPASATQRGDDAHLEHDGSTTRPNLPRRRRQTHSAVQLRTDPPSVPRDTPETGPLDVSAAMSARSPEQVRQRMSAFQSGTRRGRQSEPASD